MIREELRLNLKAGSTSEEYSENDMIKEEESDIEQQGEQNCWSMGFRLISELQYLFKN